MADRVRDILTDERGVPMAKRSTTARRQRDPMAQAPVPPSGIRLRAAAPVMEPGYALARGIRQSDRSWEDVIVDRSLARVARFIDFRRIDGDLHAVWNVENMLYAQLAVGPRHPSQFERDPRRGRLWYLWLRRGDGKWQRSYGDYPTEQDAYEARYRAAGGGRGGPQWLYAQRERELYVGQESPVDRWGRFKTRDIADQLSEPGRADYIWTPERGRDPQEEMFLSRRRRRSPRERILDEARFRFGPRARVVIEEEGGRYYVQNLMSGRSYVWTGDGLAPLVR